MTKRSSERPWQLPDGIDELLPEAATRAEYLRRRLLDRAESFGYQLVMPPMVEFTDSLLVGVGEDLDLLTFKVPDQLSGRMLGFRADITPQVARMDAHSLREHRGEAVNRLCYAGTTLHTRQESLASSRSPLQLGAELYGEPSLAGDVEIVELMLQMLETAGIALDANLTLDLGHAGVFRALIEAAELRDADLQADLFAALQRKSRAELDALAPELPAPLAEQMGLLMELHGDSRVIAQAEESLGGISADLDQALAELREFTEILQSRFPALSLYVDLAELRGYHYHTGVVFAAYTAGLGESLARGGRYNDVGEVYGRARPATGFATDLRVLLRFAGDVAETRGAIAAPAGEDSALRLAIRALRDAGETVIESLGGQVDARCGRELVLKDETWVVVKRDLANAGEAE